jgi:hypothetical protein
MKITEGNYFGDENGFKSQSKLYSVKVASTNCKLFLLPKDVSLKTSFF